MKRTTKGWMLCVQWKDKSMSWEKLSDMKESYPVEVAEYATALGIQDEPPLLGGLKMFCRNDNGLYLLLTHVC